MLFLAKHQVEPLADATACVSMFSRRINGHTGFVQACVYEGLECLKCVALLHELRHERAQRTVVQMSAKENASRNFVKRHVLAGDVGLPGKHAFDVMGFHLARFFRCRKSDRPSSRITCVTFGGLVTLRTDIVFDARRTQRLFSIDRVISLCHPVFGANSEYFVLRSELLELRSRLLEGSDFAFHVFEQRQVQRWNPQTNRFHNHARRRPVQRLLLTD